MRTGTGRIFFLFTTAILLFCIFAVPGSSAEETKGAVSISSNPSGAEVYLNDEYVGSTDLTIPDLYPGIHYVRLEKPGYESWEKIFEIKEGETTYIAHNLDESVGEAFSINTEPDDAEIYIDGEFYGYSDTVLYNLPSGQREVTLVLDGYSDYRKTVYIQQDMSQSLTHVFEPLPTTGTIIFKSEPSNAGVYLDGENVGNTMLTLEDVTPGTYNVLIKKDGFEDWEGIVEVAAGKISDILATLSAVKVPVIISTVPEEAVVIFDGNPAGITPLELLAEQGVHEIVITKFGYADVSEEMNIGYEGGDYTFELVPMAAEAIFEAGGVVSANSAFNPSEAAAALEEARHFYSAGDIESAIEWAAIAIDLATDVDRDGIVNFDDLVPGLDNRIIYISPVFIIIAAIGIIFADRRRNVVRPRIRIDVPDAVIPGDETEKATVSIDIEGHYKGYVCTIYIDGEPVDHIADTGTFDIDISGRNPGLHKIEAKLEVARERHRPQTISASRIFEVTSDIIVADELLE